MGLVREPAEAGDETGWRPTSIRRAPVSFNQGACGATAQDGGASLEKFGCMGTG